MSSRLRILRSSRCSTSERPHLTAAPRHYGSGGGGRNCAVAHGSPRSGTHRALIRRPHGGGRRRDPSGRLPHRPAHCEGGDTTRRQACARPGRRLALARTAGLLRCSAGCCVVRPVADAMSTERPGPSPAAGSTSICGGRSRLAYAALPGRAPGRARPGEAEPEQHARTSRRRQQDPPPINYLPRRVLTAATTTAATPPTAQPTAAHSARVAMNAAMTPASVSASQRPTAKGSSSTRLT
jgi:hypothetical protein